MRTLIYLASPYSNPDAKKREENYRAAANVAAKLTKEGNTVFSPISYGHTLLSFVEMPSDWAFWNNFCLTFLERSNEMWVLKLEGWEKSSGVQDEIRYCIENGIKIKYVSMTDFFVETELTVQPNDDKGKPSHTCRYSKSMHQPFPRLCVECKKPETAEQYAL